MRSIVLIVFVAILFVPPLEAQPGKTRIASMNFPPLPIGSHKSQEVRIDGINGVGGYIVADSCLDPYTMTSRVQDLLIIGGEIRVRVDFDPISPGDFRDEIVLVRRPPLAPVNDTIRIRIFGTAFRVERTEKVDFGEILVGDSVRRFVLVRADLNQDVRWEILGNLDEPFQLLNRNGPILVGGDTLAFGLSFQPTAEGRFIDTVGLVRYHKNGKPLDTINVFFVGLGLRMPKEAVVVFNGLMVGSKTLDTLTITLPAAPRAQSFVYSVVPKDQQSPVTARILSPLGPSKGQIIQIEFTCAPAVFAEDRYGFVLRRAPTGDTPVDSTNIVVNVTMKPRPISFTMGFVADTFYHRIGDTVSLDMVLTTEDPFDQPVTISSFVCDVTFNPTMLVALLTGEQSRTVIDDKPVLHLGTKGTNGTQVITGSGQVIAQGKFVVVLGDADRTPLSVMQSSISYGDGKTEDVQSNSSMVLVTNVWRYQDGRPRYVNPMQGVLVADVDPNPVLTQSTLSIRNVPSQVGRLDVIDALGQVRIDLTNKLRSGAREFTISSSGSADIVLPAGSYYARLLVEGASGGTINSVVRLFVVQ